MTAFSKDILGKLLSRLRAMLNAQYSKASQQAWVSAARIRLWATRTSPGTGSHPAETVIFSKDRALQLHGLLRSLVENVTPRVPVHVLYDCSSPGHEQAYDDVRKMFSAPDSIFIRQQSPESFRSDLLKELNSIQAAKIFFLVDDIIFIDKVDLDHFCSFDLGRYVPSLRMGLNLKRCYTMQQEQPLPPLRHQEAADADTVCWTWQEGLLDWNYPLSVDGHLFSTGEVKTMLGMVDFRAPNSLEQALQRFRPLFLNRLGIAYRRSKIVNIPCNKVQLENSNICGCMHQDELLARWQQGLQIDIHALQGFVSESAHQDVALSLVPR